MNKIRKPLLWFNKTFRTKDDLQFIILVALIFFVVFTKCYLLAIPTASASERNSSLVAVKTNVQCNGKCADSNGKCTDANCCMREHQAE